MAGYAAGSIGDLAAIGTDLMSAFAAASMPALAPSALTLEAISGMDWTVEPAFLAQIGAEDVVEVELQVACESCTSPRRRRGAGTSSSRGATRSQGCAACCQKSGAKAAWSTYYVRVFRWTTRMHNLANPLFLLEP